MAKTDKENIYLSLISTDEEEHKIIECKECGKLETLTLNEKTEAAKR